MSNVIARIDGGMNLHIKGVVQNIQGKEGASFDEGGNLLVGDVVKQDVGFSASDVINSENTLSTEKSFDATEHTFADFVGYLWGLEPIMVQSQGLKFKDDNKLYIGNVIEEVDFNE